MEDQNEIEDKNVKKFKKDLDWNRLKVFLLTFFAYSAIHCTRTGWSDAKPEFKIATKCDNIYLGIIDSTFLFSYSLALILVGPYGDKMDLKVFVLIGMVGAGICFMTVGLIGFSQNFEVSSYFIVLFMMLNGAFQSTVWPGLVTTMGNWFGKEGRGIIMGFWTGSKNFGDIFGFLIIGQLILIVLELEWQYCFLVGGGFLLLMALLNFLFLNPYPEKLGFNLVARSDSDEEKLKAANSNPQNQDNLTLGMNNGAHSYISSTSQLEAPLLEQPQKPINFFTIWKVPKVPLYALSFFCLKSSMYGMLFWLPSYLNDQGSKQLDDQAAYISAMFDVGTWIGGSLTGVITDKLGKRAIIMSPMLIISAFLMFVVDWFLEKNPLPYYFVITLIGFFLGGPYNIISATSAIDLSKQSALKSQPKALSTVTSTLEAVGAFGAAIFQLILAVTQDQAFYIFTALCFATCLALLPLAIQDYKELKEEKKSGVKPEQPVHTGVH